MRSKLVYDLPTRVFHWLFALLFVVAFVIAKTVDDDSYVFDFHSMAGLTLGFLVTLRIIWGFVGTRHARFTGFNLKPQDLVTYFWGILSGAKKKWAGHNPASSWAALIMMIFALGLALTGYLMTSGPNAESFEDVHELLANGFVVVVVLHVAGILLHTIRYRDMIGLSMIDGKKSDVPTQDEISSSQPILGILLIGLVVAFGFLLFQNYDKVNHSVRVFGTTLQLGEAEGSDNNYENHDD